jgi:ribonuclease HI
MRRFVGYFDGACAPINPGGTMGYGCYVTENGRTIWKCAGISEDRPSSNNLAEYLGLIELLEHFIWVELNNCEIEICGDSQLVIQQMSGRWRIKQGLYAEAARHAQRLCRQFTSIHFQWIPREQNDLADELSKLELTRAGIVTDNHIMRRSA